MLTKPRSCGAYGRRSRRLVVKEVFIVATAPELSLVEFGTLLTGTGEELEEWIANESLWFPMNLHGRTCRDVRLPLSLDVE